MAVGSRAPHRVVRRTEMDTGHFDISLARQYPRRALMQQLIDSVPIRTIMTGMRRNRRGRLMCLTMVALVIMMGLTGIYGSTGIGPRDAAAHADDWYTHAHYGTAKVDGVVEDGEYGEILGPGDKDPASGCLSAIQGVGSAEYHFTLCETNDDVNDYYAFIIDDLTLSTPDDPVGLDMIYILFDDEHDGSLACPHAEDAIAVAPVPGPAIFDLAY